MLAANCGLAIYHIIMNYVFTNIYFLSLKVKTIDVPADITESNLPTLCDK